jgi:hypothetical protein
MCMKFKGLKTSYDDEDTFFIVPHDNGFKLYVEPEYRHNGTQNLDGYFPRYFSQVSTAKSSLTRFLGKPEKWQEI